MNSGELKLISLLFQVLEIQLSWLVLIVPAQSKDLVITTFD